MGRAHFPSDEIVLIVPLFLLNCFQYPSSEILMSMDSCWSRMDVGAHMWGYLPLGHFWEFRCSFSSVTELNGGLLLLNRVHCNLGSKATCSKLVESLWWWEHFVFGLQLNPKHEILTSTHDKDCAYDTRQHKFVSVANLFSVQDLMSDNLLVIWDHFLFPSINLSCYIAWCSNAF